MRKLFLLSILMSLSSLYAIHAQNQTVGNLTNSSQAMEGYNLLAPQSSFNTYLIDNCGRVVQEWVSEYRIGLSAYLLDDGSLMRTAQLGPATTSSFSGGGTGGRLEKFNWEGDLTWTFVWADSVQQQHHDIEIMPNGNILILAWEYHSYEEALLSGKTPNTENNPIWCCQITEIEPYGENGGDVIWQWSAWDHLVQNTDSLLPHFSASISDAPRRFDINYISPGPNALNPDWMHCNAIDYNSSLDQIIISSAKFNEIFIIPHHLTTQETATFSGDLLWRYGNPSTYGRGTIEDKKLFFQHDCQWIDDTEGGSGQSSKILVFNNGRNRPQGNRSSVEEIHTPNLQYGTYPVEDGTSPFMPETYSWRYPEAEELDDLFYAQQISGASRLGNGNTLICNGPSGYGFEVTPEEDIVWEYINPVTAFGPTTQGNDAGNNSLFRLQRYAVEFPGFIDRDMTPGDVLEVDSWIDNCTSGMGSFETGELVAYPNPFNDVFRVTFQEKGNWKLHSLEGKLIEQGWSHSGYMLEIGGDLRKGCYILQYENRGKTVFKTLIKI